MVSMQLRVNAAARAHVYRVPVPQCGPLCPWRDCYVNATPGWGLAACLDEKLQPTDPSQLPPDGVQDPPFPLAPRTLQPLAQNLRTLQTLASNLRTLQPLASNLRTLQPLAPN